MNSNLRSRLNSLENSFLTALTEGSAALQSFHNSWLDPAAGFLCSLQLQTLDHDTACVAYSLLSRIAIIASQFIDNFEKADAISASLQGELQTMFADLSLDDESDYECTSSPPPYLEPALQWLLDNLHNPYPPKAVKLRIASDTRRSLKDVDNWFISVRRRIGWNRLRMKRFANKRFKIVEAASSCLLPQTSIRDGIPLREREQQMMDFLTIKNNAEKLYEHKNFKPCSKKLTARKTVRQKKRIVCHSVVSEESDPEALKDAKGNPVVCPYTPVSDTVPVCRKRPCRPESESEGECDYLRVSKRQRTVSGDLSVSIAASPVPSLSEDDNSSSGSAPDTLDSPGILTFALPSLSSKKRRLSDASDHGPSKVPRVSPRSGVELAVSHIADISASSMVGTPEDSSIDLLSNFPPSVSFETVNDSIPLLLEYYHFYPTCPGAPSLDGASIVNQSAPLCQEDIGHDMAEITSLFNFSPLSTLNLPDDIETFGSSNFNSHPNTNSLSETSLAHFWQQPKICEPRDFVDVRPCSDDFNWSSLFHVGNDYSPNPFSM